MVKRLSDIRCSMAVKPRADKENGFYITRVTNSVEYSPGKTIEKDAIKKLIDDGWTVSVLVND